MQKTPSIARGPGFIGALGQMKKSLHALFCASLESKQEVAIMYFGRASDFLMMTSERIVVPDGIYTLEQLLNRLRERGDRWAEELDDRHVMCSVDGRDAFLTDRIKAGDEISVYSRKSVFEP